MGGRKQQYGHEDAASGRTLPAASVLPPAGGLLVSQDHRTVIGHVVSQGGGKRIGAIQTIKDENRASNTPGVQMPFFTRMRIWDQLKSSPSSTWPAISGSNHPDSPNS